MRNRVYNMYNVYMEFSESCYTVIVQFSLSRVDVKVVKSVILKQNHANDFFTT